MVHGSIPYACQMVALPARYLGNRRGGIQVDHDERRLAQKRQYLLTYPEPVYLLATYNTVFAPRR